MSFEVNQLLFSVVTSIHRPTDAVHKLASRLREINAKLIIIGDKTSPKSYNIKGIEFISLQDQLESQFDLARKLPTDHYSRKNIGYLTAINHRASCIYDTDDDNAPLSSWTMRYEKVEAKKIEGRRHKAADRGQRSTDGEEQRWVNVYKYFTDENIWPRGFPLEEIAASFKSQRDVKTSNVSVKAPIQQSLVNKSPDVDAIYRLVFNQPLDFQQGQSVYLPPQCWCPFNSQSSWWWPDAYPLMYLPSSCTFRMTDIWRSFIAQRCLWELGYGIVFHAPEVVQERNEHNLMNDFESEIPGYTRNKELVKVLEKLSLKKGLKDVSRNLLHCYEALVAEGFLHKNELELVQTWIEDLKRASCF